ASSASRPASGQPTPLARPTHRGPTVTGRTSPALAPSLGATTHGRRSGVGPARPGRTRAPTGIGTAHTRPTARPAGALVVAAARCGPARLATGPGPCATSRGVPLATGARATGPRPTRLVVSEAAGPRATPALH